MNHSKLVLIFFVSFLCFYLGCTTIWKTGEGAGPGVRNPNVSLPMNSVRILDKSLENWETTRVEHQPEWLWIFWNDTSENNKYSKIAVENTNAKRSETGTVKVWATFRNRTDYPLTLECHTLFFDKQQAPVEEGPTAWQHVYLPQQGIGNYQEYSTNVKDVAYYIIEVREAR